MTHADELRKHIRVLSDWVDVLAAALLEQRRHMKLDHIIATVDGPRAANAAREAALIPGESLWLEIYDDEEA